MRGRHIDTSNRAVRTLHALGSAFVLCAFNVPVAVAAIPPSERAVLDALYQNTAGSGWSHGADPAQPDGWEQPSGTECSWYGITCDATQGHVSGVTLANNNLSGGPLPALTPLTRLRSFYVQGNQITGPVPDLTGLASLQTFFAPDNQLSGPIPSLSGIGLNALQGFNVSNNQLTDSIPPLNGLHVLSAFNADHNHLSGPIPDLAGLAYLANFNVENNDLSDQMPVLSGVGLINLKYVWVDQNHLSGNIPDLSGLANLRYFYANDNQLTGPIPALDALFNLQRFHVENNGLSGSPPSPPSPGSLVAGESSLCPNPLDLVSSPGWNVPTGFTPWYYPCDEIFLDGFESLP